MTGERKPNRLVDETSPYLLQHAHNPVDWYPWGTEALQKARSEDKPILLSVGYAACHWCHVMEHESFEDEETARYMNEHFVSIKVDREERPDIDSIYMDAVQAMTGHGGWPMTVFLTPDGKPFYGGTYYPKEDRHGMPAFRRILEAISETWVERRGELEDQGRRVADGIARIGEQVASRDPLSEEVLRGAFDGLLRAFDQQWGGFGPAPKFPQPMTLELVLRCHARGYPEALEVARITLDRMAAGGMYDHVGGGFHRYSVDGRWHVPHFEKMLYDNAQLARLYVHAWQVTGRERYRDVARETLDYLLREMRHPEGGLWSSQDADSEGEEGRFYVWRFDELDDVAGAEVAAYFGAVPAGNWEGTNVLWTPLPAGTVAAEAGMSEDDLFKRVEEGRSLLYERREARVRPGTDDKVLAGWNGLAIAAFAEAGMVFADPAYTNAAVAAADFVWNRMRDPSGRLLRSWRDDRQGAPAYLDDYALLADALLTLHEATFDPAYFHRARELADAMLALFHDEERGGFFHTGSDAERLVVRPKELFDNAVPAGNSVAAGLLQRLGLLTGEAEYEQAGVSALRLVRDYMLRAPTAFGHALSSLDLHLSPVREIAVAGDPRGEDTRSLAGVVWSRFLPNHVMAVGSDEGIPLLAGRSPVDGRAAAYVCEHFVCRRPVTDPDELAAELAQGRE